VALAAPARDGVEFVEEDDGRRGLPGAVEHLADCLLGLADVAVQQFRSGDVDEVDLALAGESPRQQGLAGARRAVQQHTPWRFGRGGLEQRPVGERPLDGLA